MKTFSSHPDLRIKNHVKTSMLTISAVLILSGGNAYASDHHDEYITKSYVAAEPVYYREVPVYHNTYRRPHTYRYPRKRLFSFFKPRRHSYAYLPPVRHGYRYNTH